MIHIIPGDCLESLRTFPDNCIDAVVTDPPYGLSKEPDVAEVLTNWLAGEDYHHTGSGFMGKSWDSFVPGPSVWREVLRVLKPGGHVLSFAGTRTYDLMVIAMRLGGFEIRDQLAWMYGTGFPKSANPGRDIDMRLCTEPGRHYDKNLPKPDKRLEGDHLCPSHPTGDPHRGEGTALKPAQEPIVLARKPLIGTVAKNVLAHGTGVVQIDRCRVGTSKDVPTSLPTAGDDLGFGFGSVPENGRTWGPGQDPNVGRWPANVILDEEAGSILDEQSGTLKSGAMREDQRSATDRQVYGQHGAGVSDRSVTVGDTGGASRFFYCAKASKAEREAGLENFVAAVVDDGRSTPADNPRQRGKTKRKNVHPTVKPIALMRYLVRLVTPPGGVVLDPYMGSGTTGIAAKLEGFQFVGLELSEEFCAIARARIDAQT